MIAEFEGRKFRTRDGKYKGEVVRHNKCDKDYPYWVVLIGERGSERMISATKELHFREDKEDDWDLIEVKEYDWPFGTLIFAWDGLNKSYLPKVFAGVSPSGDPQTYRFHTDTFPEWTKLKWEHAERIEVPNE